MTDKEKAIIMAYTGVAMLTGEKIGIFYEYVGGLLGRSIFTHELADANVWELIKEKSKGDFISLCEEDNRLQKEGWIPIKTRDLTDKEKHELYDAFDINILELTPRESWTYCCRLPEEDQEVLVTTNLWENVTITTFHADEDGVYFEDYEDRDDLLAWMPLPKPYKTEGGTT